MWEVNLFYFVLSWGYLKFVGKKFSLFYIYVIIYVVINFDDKFCGRVFIIEKIWFFFKIIEMNDIFREEKGRK